MPELAAMEASPFVEAVQLEPFQHQVGGHTVVLHYDETTLCKPLNKREQYFYLTLPEKFKEFTAEYRGVIDVQLQESDDGFISFIGYRRHSDSNQGLLNPRSGSSSPASSGSDTETSPDHPESPNHSPSSTHHSQNKSGTSIRFLRSGSLEVSSRQSDLVFKSAESGKMCSHSAWVLRCHKMLLTKWRKHGQSPDVSKFILLENVAAHFKRPCVLDLKMGTRQHGDDASDHKRELQEVKCLNSTSGSLGVRLCGMQVYQVNTGTYLCRDKYYGRGLSKDGFRHSLHQFLQNGCLVRLDVVKNIIYKLKKLYNLLEKQDSFRFFSVSLLVMYDGIDPVVETLSSDNIANHVTSNSLETLSSVGNNVISNNVESLNCCSVNSENVRATNNNGHDHVTREPQPLLPENKNGHKPLSRLSSKGSNVNRRTLLGNHDASSQNGQETISVNRRTNGQDLSAINKLVNSPSESPSGSAVVKMIDFAHTTHRGYTGDGKVYDGPDPGFLLGLENLIKVFQSVADEALS